MEISVQVLFLAQLLLRMLILKGLGENLFFSLKYQLALQQQPVDSRNLIFLSYSLHSIELKIVKEFEFEI